MTMQTIEVEGLPEGWKAKEVHIDPDQYNKYVGDDGCLYWQAKIKMEKIQPRRIVLEEITMSEARLGDFMRHPGDTRTIINVGAERHDETYTFYREVKETDIPLTNDEPKLSN